MWSRMIKLVNLKNLITAEKNSVDNNQNELEKAI